MITCNTILIDKAFFQRTQHKKTASKLYRSLGEKSLLLYNNRMKGNTFFNQKWKYVVTYSWAKVKSSNLQLGDAFHVEIISSGL